MPTRRWAILGFAIVTAMALTLPALADIPTEAPEAAQAAIEGCGAGAPPSAGFAGALKEKLAEAMADGNIFFALLLVLLAGFGVTLTPCVYPLIPITLSIFGARGSPSKTRGFLLSSTYVSGMILLYSGLGIGFALAGKLMGAAMQHPAVTIGVALFCVVMAASMFGAFELALPMGLQTKLSQLGGTGFKGAFVMGLVAGLIAAPCTGPVLTFILTLIARDGDVARGALFMVVFSIGIGIPFLILGTFSSAVARIPKTGSWTEAVKSVFGLMMIAAGIYFVSLGLPSLNVALGVFTSFGLWLGPALLVVGSAIGALHLSFKYTSVQEKSRKAAGLVLAVIGVVMFLGWLIGEPAHAGGGGEIPWVKVANEKDAAKKFDGILADAAQQQKPVMIDFFANWCAACKELDKLTYVEESVQSEATRFVNVKIDATADTPDLQALQKRYGIVGLPTVIFVNSKGQTCPKPRVNQFMSAEDYLPLMKSVW
jgi:thiol:disulfide interchange protein DsbD